MADADGRRPSAISTSGYRTSSLGTCMICAMPSSPACASFASLTAQLQDVVQGIDDEVSAIAPRHLEHQATGHREGMYPDHGFEKVRRIVPARPYLQTHRRYRAIIAKLRHIEH
jgi:hypothetical protein